MKFSVSLKVIILLCIISNTTLSQVETNKTIASGTAYLINMEKGKTAYNKHDYIKAIRFFKLAIDKDPIASPPNVWLAWSHYMLKNFGYSINYARNAIVKDTALLDKEAYYLMAANFHHLGEIDSAIVYYERCLKVMNKKKIKELLVVEKLEKVRYAAQELKKPLFAEAKVIKGDVNSGNNDYAPVLSSDGKTLYFTSRRDNTHGGEQNPADGLFFEDIYLAKWESEGKQWDSITNFGILDKINGDGFESMSWLSDDGQTAYITINNEAVGGKPKTNSSDIFEISFNGKKGIWDKPKAITTLNINSNGFDAAATITKDGQTMYFVSDRDLKRGSDLYVSKKDGKVWSIPVRLPDNINSLENETTPCISPDGKYLFFSSDGWLTMGGYDIFISKNLGNGRWSDPVNLGATINSVNDDTHFQYYPKFNKGMFAKRTISNMKSDIDIYEIDMTNFKFPN